MSTQQTHRHKDEEEPPDQQAKVVQTEKPNHDELDRLLEELDDIVDFKNAKDFMANYIQKGGQ